jgi:GNAT superfamily N-acetyltransferase
MIQIREMKKYDTTFAFRCTRREGWSSETEDTFSAFLEYDPRGNFIAEAEGLPVGLCVAIAYRKHGFIGELIVIEEERGKGYGKALFKHSVEYLKSRIAGSLFLDGDLEAVPIYEKFGFHKICRSLRFLGFIESADHPGVHTAGTEDVDRVCAIDKTYFGDDRSFFIRRAHRTTPEMFFVLKKRGKIRGYIMARPGVGVVSVGPYALLDPAEDPLVLLRWLARKVPDQPLRFGLLETQHKAVEVVRKSGAFQEQVPCWRMGLGQSADLGMDGHLIAVGSAAKG